ncbi:MAG: aldo/keto reductase, partial [Chloroflexota bacterium]
MNRRQFGHTSLWTTAIGYGMAAVGRPAYINIGHEKDLRHSDLAYIEKQAFRALDTAWEAGIRYFDVARSYGRAEEFLARWLEDRSISQDEVTVGSKWGYTYVGDWKIDADVHEVKNHSRATLIRQWAETQHNLGRYLNLYQIHSATLDTGVLEDDAVLDQLWEIHAAGTTVGLSLSGAQQSRTLYRALDVERNGERLFESVQATWNVLERGATEALATAHAEG